MNWSLSSRVRHPVKNSMTRGLAFIFANGSRSESFHRRSSSRSVSNMVWIVHSRILFRTGGIMKTEDCVLFSGAANGAESAFGAAAERHGIEEVNFTFEGHTDNRTRGIRVLTHAELQQGDVSLTYVSRLMNRTFSDSPIFRKILQSIWHQ